MGRYMKKCYIYFSTFNWTAPEREYLDWNKDQMIEFNKTFPMPENNLYGTAEEVIASLITGTGAIVFDIDVGEDFIEWIDYLIDEGLYY